MRALGKVLGEFLLGALAMALLLVGVFAFASWQSGFPVVEAVVGCWQFILGAAVLTGLGTLAGFTPDDLGNVGQR